MNYRFLAPAKINLALRIVGRRQDGYHLLWTVMTFFPLYDQLEITVPAADLQLHCEPPVTADPTTNLVWRAARRLQEVSGTRQGARLHLTKQIPHGAGLGGGSSDAATTLLALNQLWHLHLSRPHLIEIGARLGADIPIFLGGEAALAEGIGERLTPLPHLATAALVVVNPGYTLSTAAVFQHWHRQQAEQTARSAEPPLSRWQQEGVWPVLGNDLESTAMQMVPAIGLIPQALRQLGARATLMSGSGSSLFGLFAGLEEAEQAAATLRAHHPEWQIFSGQTFNRHPFSDEQESGIRIVC
ncbi:MAG: 4-(cytidine 5'-diphospho)-2-C-methyl-D-erythritol kinase [Magnetococcales bacterium]|nr:4-(cytidine 5'-diphospho)-2-C-methyl-D-erythritol kinase [Magnetococcales bacterium]